MKDLMKNGVVYTAPRIEVIEINVEAGFAESATMDGLPNYGIL